MYSNILKTRLPALGFHVLDPRAFSGSFTDPKHLPKIQRGALEFVELL